MDWLSVVVSNPVFLGMAKTLLHFLWQGSILAFVLYLLLKNIDTRLSNLRYGVALAVLCLCFAMPIATFVIIYEPQAAVTSKDISHAIATVTDAATQVGNTLLTINETSPVAWTLAVTELNQYIEQVNLQAILPFMAIAWMMGVVLLSGKLLLQVFNVYQLPYQQTVAPEPEMQRLFNRLVMQLGANPVTRLLISYKIDVPMVIGWLKPVVLLPSAMIIGLTPHQIEMLLAHELAHVRRHDYLVNFLQTLVEVMLFFHPAVKWISQQIRAERENCCDDVAVAHCGNPLAYATALTDAEMSRFTNIPQLAMAASGSDLKKRVFRVVGHSDCAHGVTKHKYTGVMAALVSLSLVVMIFSTHQVNGMPHTEKAKTHEQSLVVVAPAPIEIEKDDSDSNASANKAITNKETTETRKANLIATMTAELDAEDTHESLENATDNNLPYQENEPALVADFEKEIPLNESDSVIAESIPAPAELGDEVEQRDVKEQVAVESQHQKQNVGTAAQITQKSIEIPVTDNAETIAENKQDPSEQTPTERMLDEPSATHQKQAIAAVASKQKEKIIKAPVLLESEHPDYPRLALTRNLTADVQVSFVVDEQGRVQDIQFDEDTHRTFRKSVRKALSKWRFEPATENGKAVANVMTKVFSFTNPDQDSLAITGSRIARHSN